MRIQGTTQPSDGWTLDFVQRQAKQTRSYLQVWYLIYHKVEVSHLPNHITRLLLPPTFDICISIVIVDLNLRLKYFTWTLSIVSPRNVTSTFAQHQSPS